MSQLHYGVSFSQVYSICFDNNYDSETRYFSCLYTNFFWCCATQTFTCFIVKFSFTLMYWCSFSVIQILLIPWFGILLNQPSLLIILFIISTNIYILMLLIIIRLIAHRRTFSLIILVLKITPTVSLLLLIWTPKLHLFDCYYLLWNLHLCSVLLILNLLIQYSLLMRKVLCIWMRSF